jgi:type I restriction enzyme S subunit
MTIPVAPLNEQRRIVAKIEALQARSSAAKEALDAIPPLLEKFRQSVLAAAFRGDLTKKWREAHPDVEPASELLKRIRAERRRKWQEANPKKQYVEPEPVDTEGFPELPVGWCWASVEELCWDGPTNGYSGATEGTSLGTLTMKLSATTLGKLLVNDSTTKRLTETLEAGSKFWLRPGDLLVQRANSLPYLGAAAIFEPGDEPMVYPDLMIRLRAIDLMTTTLLWRYFNSMACRQWFQSKATGTAGNMPKINGEVLRRTAIPVPPRTEAERLLELVAQVFEVIDAVADRSSALDGLQNSLNQSILAKAFRGALVPQDPNDEPAQVLLDRIRRERDGQGAATAKRGRKPAIGT